jgi:carbamoyl-phosphate synthase large subunit
MRTKVLLSGLGGSLFPYLHDKLKSKYELYYVDSDESLKELYPNYNFHVAPKVTDTAYIDFIKELMSQYAIDLYVPLIDEEIEVAYKIKEFFPSLSLLSPQLSFCTLSIKKNLLMEELAKNKISDIKSWTGKDFKWKDGNVFFVKPISGRGSRGIKKISSEEELNAYYILEKYAKEEILVQEYISGQEYTVGVLINKNDEILYISSKKILKKKGITIMAVTENNPLIEEAIYKINNCLKPKGPINIQL